MKQDGVILRSALDSFESPGWRIRRPTSQFNGRTVLVPTVHTYGDQRVIRCAQSLLDAGYGVHLIWMGGVPGTSVWSDQLAETRLPKACSTRDRLIALPKLAYLASRRHGAAWHIHDYYMLPFALIWHSMTSKPVIFDVHEYYGSLYAMKLPRNLRHIAESRIDRFQVWAAARMGGVNVVAPSMVDAFRNAGAPVSVSPNYPIAASFVSFRRPLTADLLKRVIHTGSLSPAYGSEILVDIACQLRDSGSDVVLHVVARFSSTKAEHEFFEYLDKRGSPINLRLIEPVPAHSIPLLLSGYGIGISALQDQGQNSKAVATKLYEYVCAGLAILASDLDAQRAFVQNHAYGVLVSPSASAAYAAAILEIISNESGAIANVEDASCRALKDLSWEFGASPELQALARSLI